MIQKQASNLVRIGIFYDGNYFHHVSNYYNYVHSRQRRLSISGIHEFIRQEVSDRLGMEKALCQITNAHYFRTRMSAKEASNKGSQLYFDRVFDDILMSEGVNTHYLPIRTSFGRKDEKSIDVWLALEAYEQTLHKQFDVVVLIASDRDYLPLVRKLNTLGSALMVLSWDFEYTTEDGRIMTTKTSQDLINEVSFPVGMHSLIDDPENEEDEIISNLFVPFESSSKQTYRNYDEEAENEGEENEEEETVEVEFTEGEEHESEILSIHNGYGFIRFPNNNLYFYYADVENVDFYDLHIGDQVTFVIEKNSNGDNVAKNINKIEAKVSSY